VFVWFFILFYMLFVVLCVVVLIVTFSLTSRASRELHELMDTEIIDYNGEAFSLQAHPSASDLVLFSMHGNSSSSSSLEMGVANNFVSGVGNTLQRNINLNMMQRTQPHQHPYHRGFSQPLTSWSGSIVCSEIF